MLPNEIIGLLGLAQRAGKVIIGTTAVSHEIRRSRETLLIFATDFSPSTKARLLAQAAIRPHIMEFGTMQEWGAFFGRQRVGVIAVTDKHFMAGLRQKLIL
jgi:ribosomal protein L7Ae-like RNA K-turn-binding protein